MTTSSTLVSTASLLLSSNDEPKHVREQLINIFMQGMPINIIKNDIDPCTFYMLGLIGTSIIISQFDRENLSRIAIGTMIDVYAHEHGSSHLPYSSDARIARCDLCIQAVKSGANIPPPSYEISNVFRAQSLRNHYNALLSHYPYITARAIIDVAFFVAILTDDAHNLSRFTCIFYYHATTLRVGLNLANKFNCHRAAHVIKNIITKKHINE